jgi:hypothetical protein
MHDLGLLRRKLELPRSRLLFNRDGLLFVYPGLQIQGCVIELF